MSEHTSNQKKADNIPSACSGCPNADPCREVWGAERRGSFTPAGLSFGSVLVFILPLAFAVVGAIMGHSGNNHQQPVHAGELIGAAAGLVIGIVTAKTLMPIVKKYGTKLNQNACMDSPKQPLP